MNKVIIEKNKFQVHGNTVLAPDESYKKQKYEDLEKSRKQINDAKNKRDVKKKKSVLINILLVFVIGITIIARYSMIYNIQDTTSKTRDEIAALSKDNLNSKEQIEMKISNNIINKIKDIVFR